MRRNLNILLNGRRVSDTGRTGAIGSSVPSSGQHGPGMAHNEVVAYSLQNAEVRTRIKNTNLPSGSWKAYTDTGFETTQVVADGKYTITYDFYIFGKKQPGDGVISFAIGTDAPIILQQPRGPSARVGQTATFSVVSSGAAPLSYQWQRQPQAGGGYSNIGGATSSSYSTGPVSLTGGTDNNGDTFRCVVSNSAGSATSNAVKLEVKNVHSTSNKNVSSGSGQGINLGFGASAPTADFIGSPLSGSTPLTVTFTNQSTGSITSYLWNFGDGGTSTSANPSHAYLVAGTYTVTLTATGPGGSNTRTRTSYVTATAVVPTTATLSVASTTATTGGSVSAIVTLDAVADQTYVITLAEDGSDTSLSGSTVTITAGSISGSRTLTNGSTPEAVHVSIVSVAPSLTAAGSPRTVTFSAPAAPGSLPSFVLSPGATGTMPFAFGHTFRQGDVPAGQVANATGATDWQCTPMTYWPDGSLKHAIVAGRAAVTSGVDKTLTLAAGTAAAGTALTEADLASALPATTIDIGGDITTLNALVGTAALHTTVCTGPVMSSWVYRRAVSGNAHLVVFVEVRLFTGGAVEIFPWVENGYLSVASPTNFVRTCTVTIGGVQRFSQSIDIKHHTRVPLITGSAFSHWVGPDPQIKPKHDRDYLINSKLIPNLAAAAPAGATLDALQQTYAPNTLAGDTTANGAAGGEGGIISVPSAYYVTSSADTRAYAAMMVHALSSGSWSHHYRDEATNLPIAFSSRPLATLADTSTPTIPTPTGGENAAGPAMSHSVSYAYLPWLTTGRWWFLEELHFWATFGYLSTSAAYRGNGAGWHVHAQPRFRAWSLNVLAQSASVTPASHPLRAEFLASWEANTSRHYGRFVSGTVDSGTWVSPIGVLGTYSGAIGQPSPFPPPNPSTAWWDGAYQQNYLATVFGYTRDIGIPQSAQSQSDHVAVSNHAYKLVVGRGNDGLFGRYNWRRFIAYGLPIGTDDAGIPLDSWYSTHDDVYAELVSGYDLSSIDPAYGGALKSHSTDTDMAGGTSLTYGSTALAALALAVDHEAPDANLAWYRVSGASNFGLFDAYFSDEAPYWGIKPRLASWIPVASGGVATVQNLSATTVHAALGRSVSWWVAWSTVAYAPWWGRHGSIIASGGGHGDGNENDILRIDLGSRAFSVIKPTYPGPFYNKTHPLVSPYVATGSPADGFQWANNTVGDYTTVSGEQVATHNYGNLLAVPDHAISGGGGNGWLFKAGLAAMAGDGNVSSKVGHKLRMGVDTLWTTHGPVPNSSDSGAVYSGVAYDPKRNRIWFMQYTTDPTARYYYRLMVDGTSGFFDATGVPAAAGGYGQIDYSARHDALLQVVSGQIFYFVDLNTNIRYNVLASATGTPPTFEPGTWAASWSDVWNCFIYLRGLGDSVVYFLKPTGNPRSAPWAWSSQNTNVPLNDANAHPAFGRVRHVTSMGNTLVWCARTDQPVQLIGVTAP